MDQIQHFRGLGKRVKKFPDILRSSDIEDLETNGYCILESFLDEEDILNLIREIKNEHEYQTRKWKLTSTSPEYGQVRSPIHKSEVILDLIRNKDLVEILESLFVGSPIYHLVNGQVTQPGLSHNQSKWHRDFNKLHISNPPIAFNALFMLGELKCVEGISNQKLDTPKLELIPKSHKEVDFPDQTRAESIIVQPGSILLFNSLLWHRVSESENYQFFLNIMATEPFIKQQIDRLGTSLAWLDAHGGLETKLAQLLGFWSKPPSSIDEFRNPVGGIRSYRSGQG